MEKFSEIGEYEKALGQANAEIVHGGERVVFNGFENTITFLQELLNPEIYLYRAIREIYNDTQAYNYEKRLITSLEKLKGLFYEHPVTGRMTHKNLKLKMKGKPLEYSELSLTEQERITEFIMEQQGSLCRVKHKVEQYQLAGKKNEIQGGNDLAIENSDV